MHMVTEGVRNGKSVRLTYDMCDRFDERQGISSMARTTGFPCAAAARLILRGDYVKPGINPPEFIGADTEFDFEILAIEESGNQTITERCFEVAE